MLIDTIKTTLHQFIITEKSLNYQRFFKTAEGEYAYGDKFLGVSVPNIRKVVKEYFRDVDFKTIKYLLYSSWHEERLLALLLLTKQYQSKQTTLKKKEQIFNFYIQHSKQINNWDLVDVTSPHIIGNFLLDKDRDILYKFANSKNLWEKRISIVSTFEFIKYNQFDDTLKISKILLLDKHDLIHKAVGWGLRNVGNKDIDKEILFLNKYHNIMPRTMLRYAIEKFDKPLREKYLIKRSNK